MDSYSDNCTIQSNKTGQYLQLNGKSYPALGTSESIPYEFSNGVLKLYENDGCEGKYYLKIETGDKNKNEVSASKSPSGAENLVIYKIVETTATETGVILTKFAPTTATTATPIDDGGYVVYNQGSIMGHSTNEAEADGHAIGINQKVVTVSGDTINTLVTDQYYFEHVEDNLYYVSIAAQGEGGGVVYQYLTFNGSNNYLAFTPNKSLVKVYVRADGTVCISDPNSNAKANNFSTNGNIFSSYTGGSAVETTNDGNEIFTLYRNPGASKDTIVRADKTALYEELIVAVMYTPDGGYTEASYNNFLKVLEGSIAI